MEVNLANVADIRRLDAAFGLVQVPNTPPAVRTGLFIIALRPVEFTANPIASYPTTVNGARGVEDGDIVEATAITLIPYPDDGGAGQWDARRAQAAWNIFVHDGMRALPEQALPLAMLGLENGVVQWLDMFMVRREVGAEHSDVAGLASGRRATREAHLLQYDDHLDFILARLARRGPAARRFSASDFFRALPPAGRLPAEAIDPATFSQHFFPPEMDVELSLAPEDELRAMIEDSLLLPPIDLTAGGDALRATSILVLLPVDRSRLAALKAELQSVRRPLRPAVPGLAIPFRDVRAVRGLILPDILRRPPPLPVPLPDPIQAAWTREFRSVPRGELWYVRRRNLQEKIEITGLPVRVEGDDLAEDEAVRGVVDRVKLRPVWDTLRGRLTAPALRAASGALASPRIAASPLLSAALLRRLKKEDDEGRRGLVDTLRAAEPLARPGFGEGVRRLEKVHEDLVAPEVLTAVLDADEAVRAAGRPSLLDRLDAFGRGAREEDVETVSEKVAAIARGGDPDKPARLEAVLEMAERLAAPLVRAAPVVSGAIRHLLERADPLDPAVAGARAVVLSEAAAPGLRRLEAIRPEAAQPEVVAALIESGALANVEALAARVEDRARLAELAVPVLTVAAAEDRARDARLRAAVSVAARLAVPGDTPPVVADAARTRLENVAGLDRKEAERVARAFSRPDFGAGLERLVGEHAPLADPAVVKTLSDAGVLEHVDRLGSKVADAAARTAVAKKLVALSAEADEAERRKKIRALVAGELWGLRR